MKKLLVSGAGGFVGARIMTQLAGRYELCAFPKRMLAAADEQTVADWVRREQPDVIVHTAALSDTGYSEKHPDESYRANVLLPCWMAAAAQKSGAKLVAFSSDQVYTGLTEHGPFDEDTPLSPANVYGRHKQEMEQRVLDILPDAVLLRAAWMYDLPGYGLPIHGNFLLNLLIYKQVLIAEQMSRYVFPGEEVTQHRFLLNRSFALPVSLKELFYILIIHIRQFLNTFVLPFAWL